MMPTWPTAGRKRALQWKGLQERCPRPLREKWHALAPQGAETMLKMRAIYLSGDFDEYWGCHVQRDQQRLYAQAAGRRSKVATPKTNTQPLPLTVKTRSKPFAFTDQAYRSSSSSIPKPGRSERRSLPSEKPYPDALSPGT
jgi:5-formyltetrahydrofolate cyclo-ligase